MRKILFLDIDGVLNTEQQQWKCQMESIPPADKFGYTFDPKAVSCFGEILNITGAEIVLLPEQQVHFVKCILNLELIEKLWKLSCVSLDDWFINSH